MVLRPWLRAFDFGMHRHVLAQSSLRIEKERQRDRDTHTETDTKRHCDREPERERESQTDRPIREKRREPPA
eukprot:3804525-Rhodomonas_salina.2